MSDVKDCFFVVPGHGGVMLEDVRAVMVGYHDDTRVLVYGHQPSHSIATFATTSKAEAGALADSITSAVNDYWRRYAEEAKRHRSGESLLSGVAVD